MLNVSTQVHWPCSDDIFPSSRTHPKVKAKCEQHMVADHLCLLQSECHSMVVQERERDLALIYPLLRSVQGGIQVLINEIMEHIKQKGSEAIAGIRGENYHVLFIESLLAVHNKYRTLIQVRRKFSSCNHAQHASSTTYII